MSKRKAAPEGAMLTKAFEQYVRDAVTDATGVVPDQYNNGERPIDSGECMQLLADAAHEPSGRRLPTCGICDGKICLDYATFIGCGHTFHGFCLSDDGDQCPTCGQEAFGAHAAVGAPTWVLLSALWTAGYRPNQRLLDSIATTAAVVWVETHKKFLYADVFFEEFYTDFSVAVARNLRAGDFHPEIIIASLGTMERAFRAHRVTWHWKRQASLMKLLCWHRWTPSLARIVLASRGDFSSYHAAQSPSPNAFASSSWQRALPLVGPFLFGTLESCFCDLIARTAPDVIVGFHTPAQPAPAARSVLDAPTRELLSSVASSIPVPSLGPALGFPAIHGTKGSGAVKLVPFSAPDRRFDNTSAYRQVKIVYGDHDSFMVSTPSHLSTSRAYPQQEPALEGDGMMPSLFWQR